MSGTALPLEVLTGERRRGSGVTKENKTMKLLLSPGSAPTPDSIVGAVISKLAELRDSFVHDLGAVLLGYGDLKITEVVNIAEEEVEGETGGPREVRVEGEFFLFKTPEAGQELICQLVEISQQKLTFTVRENIMLEIMYMQLYRPGDPTQYSKWTHLEIFPSALV